MSAIWYDPAGQQQRRAQALDLLVQHTLDSFGPDGNPAADTWAPGQRERLWLAQAFLGSGQPAAIERASAIIETTQYSPCAFAPMTALQLLLRHEADLSPAALAALRGYAAGQMDDLLEDHHDFVGVNDNFPCMATAMSLFGGMVCDRPDLHARGMRRLEQLRALLLRRGVDSEYASPTYTAIHAYALAEIANLCPDAAAVEMALAGEHRVWVDLLGHYHPPTCQIAGPYSRAYTVDSLGQTHQARYAYWALFGDRMAVTPLETLFPAEPQREGQFLHGNLPFMQVSLAWITNMDYHCPPALVEAALARSYPHEFVATTEFSSSTDDPPGPEPRDPSAEDETYEYQSGAGVISTWMQEDYALGVASHEFHNGVQTDAFHLLYRKRPVTSHRDVATVYSRYVINDKLPGAENFYREFGYTNGSSLLWDEGRKLGLHHESTAMQLYKPKIYGHRGVTSLKLCLLFPALYGAVEELWLGEQRLPDLVGESAEPCPIFVKDGPVHLAFHPLLLTDHGRQAAIRVERLNEFVVVSLYNYEGPERDFARRGFLLTGNGYVAEVGSEREESFAAFRARVGSPEISDRYFSCVHSRWTWLRQTKYEREGLTLEAEYSPVSEGLKHVAVNGRVPEAPRLRVTGLEVEKLPWW